MRNRPIHVSEESQTSIIHYLAGLPILMFIIIITILALFHNEAVWSPHFLIPALNITFLSFILFFVSVLAARSYLIERSATLLLLGCGTLTLSLGAFLGVFSLLGNNINSTISIYNTAACLSGSFHLASVIFSLRRRSVKPRSGWPYLLFSYFIVLLAIGILALLIKDQLWPVYFIQGSGDTLFGSIVIYITITLFAISSILLMATKTKNSANFKYWYGLGLGLIAVGLFGVSIQMNLGDSLNWVGRISQYLGTVYILIAVLSSIWQTGVWMLPWEKALQESEERYKLLFDTMLQGVIFQDSEGHITSMNPAAEKIIGYTLNQIQGRTLNDLIGKTIHENGQPFHVEEYPSIVALKTGQEVRNVVMGVYSASRNDYTWINIHAVPEFRQGEKSPYQVYMTFEDISKRKQIDEKLKHARDNLEKQVKERTLELEKVVDELKRSNEELQSFAYITSHDLQEPLRTIASYAQLIKRRYKGQLDQDADEFIDFMVNGASRMKNMIQGLLDYSRVGTQGHEFKEFKSEDALNYAINNLQSAINENNAKITYDELPTIFADKNQIASVFQNLIGNALKFQKDGLKPEIHISANKKGNEYVFSVRDNGIGIEEQYTRRIFEVFKRLHTIDEYEGAGIGLAIVKRIIDRHGGRVWVESEFGEGSAFYFTIYRQFQEMQTVKKHP